MKGLLQYSFIVFSIWMVGTSPAMAAKWEKVAGDDLKATVDNKTWKSRNFSLDWRDDGKRLLLTTNGGRWVEDWMIEEDGVTLCSEGAERGKRCGYLEKKKKKYRLTSTTGPNAGKKWSVSVKDGIRDF